MEAKELRIGNWVIIGNKDILTVLSICFDRNKGHLINGYEESLFKPIEITPEILEKAGFRRSSGGSVLLMDIAYTDTDLPCSLQTSGGNKMLICRGGTYSIGAQCDYIHQLQNLYFALTQTELKINL